VAPNIFNSITAVLSKNMKHFCMISGFRHEVCEKCALLGQVVVISYQSYGTTYRSHLQGVKPLKIDPRRWDW
jgi:hypothetical protein